MGGGGTLARERWPLKIAACTGVGERPDTRCCPTFFPALTWRIEVPIRKGCPAARLRTIFLPGQMAEKKARTAEKGGEVTRKRPCPSCGGDSRVLQFAGYGPRGFFWVCEKNCGYTERTR